MLLLREDIFKLLVFVVFDCFFLLGFDGIFVVCMYYVLMFFCSIVMNEIFYFMGIVGCVIEFFGWFEFIVFVRLEDVFLIFGDD